jgi:hypothetical protein
MLGRQRLVTTRPRHQHRAGHLWRNFVLQKARLRRRFGQGHGHFGGLRYGLLRAVRRHRTMLGGQFLGPARYGVERRTRRVWHFPLFDDARGGRGGRRRDFRLRRRGFRVCAIGWRHRHVLGNQRGRRAGRRHRRRARHLPWLAVLADARGRARADGRDRDLGRRRLGLRAALGRHRSMLGRQHLRRARYGYALWTLWLRGLYVPKDSGNRRRADRRDCDFGRNLGCLRGPIRGSCPVLGSQRQRAARRWYARHFVATRGGRGARRSNGHFFR